MKYLEDADINAPVNILWYRVIAKKCYIVRLFRAQTKKCYNSSSDVTYFSDHPVYNVYTMIYTV